MQFNSNVESILRSRHFLVEKFVNDNTSVSTRAYLNAYLLSNFGIVVDEPNSLTKEMVEQISELFHLNVPKSFYANPQGKLVTAAPVAGLKERLQDALTEKTGVSVLLDEAVNPEILGGFVLNIDDYRVDASVEGQFRLLRRELIDNNNRIV